MAEIYIHTYEGSGQLPIGTIAEGHVKVGKNRNQFVGKTYCASRTGTGEDLSRAIAVYIAGIYIAVYIAGIYDVDFLERILKYADGANWMDGALTDGFAGLVIYVLDAYHRFKYITLLRNTFRGKRAQVRKSLYRPLKKNDKEARYNRFRLHKAILMPWIT